MHVPPKSNEHATLGFLTAMDFDGGWVGGCLVLNLTGRPLEFHCTAPVKPTRAQEILYGPTLLPFLLGEQIGGTLLAKTKSKPMLVVTDQHDMLSARGICSTPIACLASQSDVEATLTVGDSRLMVARGYPQDRDQWLQCWGQLKTDLPLAEPFSRIHEAISEAQKSRAKAA